MSRPTAVQVAALDLSALAFPLAPSDDVTVQLAKSLYFRCTEFLDSVGSPEGREAFTRLGEPAHITHYSNNCSLCIDMGDGIDGAIIAQRFEITDGGALRAAVTKLYRSEERSLICEVQPLFVDAVFLHEALKHRLVFGLVEPMRQRDEDIDLRPSEVRSGWHADAESTVVVLPA